MDNLTHSLVGLAVSKAGLERLSPGATLLCVVAANAPDADIAVLLFGDRWTFLEHHRGITHSIVGTVFFSLFLPLALYAAVWAFSKWQGLKSNLNLRGLIIASTVASVTHPILDWTNNYGIRFLLPWNPKWFYGDFVFIVDPVLWLILGGAAFLLTSESKFQKLIWALIAAALTIIVIFGSRAGQLPHGTAVIISWLVTLVTLIVLFVLKAEKHWGSRIAHVALVLALLYWTGLFTVHRFALTNARETAASIVPAGEKVNRIAAMPTLANPLRWDCVFDTNKATYRFNLMLGSEERASGLIRYEKPTGVLADAYERAARERPARVFLGFARFPVAKLSEPDCIKQTLVQFADLRYTEPGRTRGSFALELPIDCPEMPGD